MFVLLSPMKHRGEIIEQAIRNSGLPISHIAKKLKKSRQWMYVMFENPNVPVETIQEISKIINHDFSDEIKGMPMLVSDVSSTNGKTAHTATYWREKYYTLLEEYHELIKKTQLKL
jgi:hypothetical protein